MPKVVRKTNVRIDVEVMGRDDTKRGHLTLTTGNIHYYRPNAKTATATYTYQQLIDLIEEQLA